MSTSDDGDMMMAHIHFQIPFEEQKTMTNNNIAKVHMQKNRFVRQKYPIQT
jgi:hypothetical protein